MNKVKELYLAVGEFIKNNPNSEDFPSQISHLISWFSYLEDDENRDIILGDKVLDVDGVKERLISYVKKSLPENDEDDRYNISAGHASKKRLEQIIDNINAIKTHEDIIKLSKSEVDIYGDRLYAERVADKLVFNYLYYNKNFFCDEKLISRIIPSYLTNPINLDNTKVQEFYDSYILSSNRSKLKSVASMIKSSGIVSDEDKVKIEEIIRKYL